ncbi:MULTISPECIES: beta-glucosidase [Haloarcula]|uniref:Glycosyl hydrolase n=1 Tax=Haloarcula pellucida TaxID=1427151 RepID=A0A830GKX6_9EURY|nr:MULTISPECIES: glycoside hydrolase family 3 C-terminal domain-containing protein [Halomicroarcula]MBX0347879.1 glycoside hydrolase family 3 C-terminal domain-containing protein [Halomicroarcula pellucida]MDS0276187.1 glycoside hydrolase family 3 C-terminal domain-containing protein [Halomicroarcula sp. S1AR25-4]GGN90714.1 glycosyl hydrolase [Halomicroarcula pellucida]
MERTPADVDTLLAEMDRAEKLSLVRGTDDPEGTATGFLPGVERLGIPPFRLVDGPLGIRAEGERATAFPASLATAATFDPDLARTQGAAMAREARAHDQDALLAPGVNIIRVPQCGRNFEYLSEDPVHASDIGRALVSGIQSEDVVATVKHFVANNQETHRTTVSADVDERTLRELYLPPFRAAVEGGVGSVMTAYNRVNGTHMSDHERLVGDVLKDEWGFGGYVVSDWYGLETTVGAANAGLDVEMPGVPEAGDDALDDFEWPDGIPDATHAGLFGDPLATALDDGDVSPERLDDMVTRVLGQMARIGLFDDEDRPGELDSQRHRDLAERLAVRGTVLLDNDDVLPLADDADVAVVGPHVHEPKLGGGGSSETTPFHSVSPADGIESRADGTVTVAPGVPEIEDVSLFDLLPFVESGHDSDGGSTPPVDPSLDAAVDAAADADVPIVVVRDATTEARDRDSLSLPGRQDELVEAVAAANDRTVVVVRSGGPVEMPWRDDVAAVLEQWYPGQADGSALATVLYGDRDPGGRLPVTFAPEEAYPTSDERRFPGVDGVAHYDEGLFVGYRHFDATDHDPTYPFGHGHSYATFEYRDAVAIDESTVEVTVENVADRPGREVVQAYVRPPDTDDIDRPVRELAAFDAVALDAGESRTVSLSLDHLAFSRYDPAGGWTVDDGRYTVDVARSAADVRASVRIDR